MPKPTQAEITEVHANWAMEHIPGAVLVDRLNALWSEAWDRDRMEMMQPQPANEESGEEWLRGDGAAADVDAFNDLQRARREGLLYAWTHFMNGKEVPSHSRHFKRTEMLERVAKVYPLKKRVPRTVADPHLGGEWTVAMMGPHPLAYRASKNHRWAPIDTLISPSVTKERVQALAALLADPFEWVDDTSIETVGDFSLGV